MSADGKRDSARVGSAQSDRIGQSGDKLEVRMNITDFRKVMEMFAVSFCMKKWALPETMCMLR